MSHLLTLDLNQNSLQAHGLGTIMVLVLYGSKTYFSLLLLRYWILLPAKCPEKENSDHFHKDSDILQSKLEQAV